MSSSESSGRNIYNSLMKGALWKSSLVWFVVFFVAAIARFYNLTTTGIWLDEAFSVLLSVKSVSEILFHTARDVHPPLYYLILHGWINIFGEGVFSVRSLSLFFGMASVVLGIWLARLLMSQRAVIVAGALLAIFPGAVRYSQEVRMYSLLGALMLGATIAFVYWLKQPENKRILLVYTGLMVAGLYTHYFAALCMFSHWTYLVLQSTWRSGRYKYIKNSGWWLANIMIVLCFLPWVPSLLNQMRYSAVDWVPEVSVDKVVDLVGFFLHYSEGASLPDWMIYGLALMVWAGSIAIWVMDKSVGRNSVLLVVYVWCPVVVIALVSLIHPMFYPRYLFFAMLALPLVIAVMLDRLLGRSNIVFGVGVLLFVVVELLGLWHVYNKLCEECWETNQLGELAEYVNSTAQPGDGVLVLQSFMHLSMVYYNRLQRLPMEYTPPHTDGSSGRPNGYQISTLLQDKADEVYVENLESLRTESGRLWLVDEHGGGTLTLKIPKHWKLLSTQRIGKDKVQLVAICPVADSCL